MILKRILNFIFRNRSNKIKITTEMNEIINLIENTNTNLFITGEAGTGKSTLLQIVVKRKKKNYIVLAPTGVAALNTKGRTIHSFFRFPFGIIDIKKN